MRLFLVLSFAIIGLSGCFVSAQDGDKKIVYSDGEKRTAGNSHVCPPGHAKKGWC